jgi:hypothetical protein
MKKRIAVAIIVLLFPAISLAGHGYYDRHSDYYYRQPPPRYWDGPPRHHYYRDYPRRGYAPRHHRNNDWIVPAAIIGTALGVAAISSQTHYPPPPPQRICQDTYNHFDEYGRFLYSERVNRPCNW